MRDIMLIIHFLGIAMAVGNGFAQLFLSKVRKNMDENDSQAFLMKTLYLNLMGKIGLGLLIISGGALMTPYWSSLSSMPAMMVKLVLVIAIIALVGIASVAGKKLKKGGDKSQLPKIVTIGKSIFVLGLVIIVLAVFTFH
jgi:hypothetical protein